MNNEDLLFHKALMKILDEATYSLKAREVASFIKVYEWTKEIPSKFVSKPKLKKSVNK